MLDAPTHTSDEEIIAVITRGINEGKAQSACIWSIIRQEKGAFMEEIPGVQKEWNDRYREIDAFITQKGLCVPEKSPLIAGFQRDVRRLLLRLI